MARKKKIEAPEAPEVVAEAEEKAPEAPEAPKVERSARAGRADRAATTEAGTRAYPTNPVSNPGFDDGTTLRDGTAVNAIPTGDGSTVDATLTYGVDVALANTAAVTDVEKLALADTMGRVAALHDEQAYDPYERANAV